MGICSEFHHIPLGVFYLPHEIELLITSILNPIIMSRNLFIMAIPNLRDLSYFLAISGHAPHTTAHQDQQRTDARLAVTRLWACAYILFPLIGYFCLKRKRRPMKKNHNLFHQSRWPWGSHYSIWIQFRAKKPCGRVCVQFYQDSGKSIQFFRDHGVQAIVVQRPTYHRDWTYKEQIIWESIRSYKRKKNFAVTFLSKLHASITPRHTAPTASHSPGDITWGIR